MVKKQKRGQAGSAAQYLTRSQALKKLQLKLPQFRRLCILKGIHPREPKKKAHGQNKTYYHIKDINFLLHEPLIQQFRDSVAYEKKIRKARARKNKDLLQRLMDRRPQQKLDHLVKERYPSFIDALRDLDDALTLVFLFGTLPAEKMHKLPQKQLELCRRISLEWQAYIVRSHSLRKVFVTVRGYYFQAEVMAQTITWMTPHQVGQILPSDVDYRVMLTFLEFYVVLLRFVNYKLYHSLGLKYPPGLSPELEEAAAGLEAIMQGLAKQKDGNDVSEDTDANNTEGGPFQQLTDEAQQAAIEQEDDDEDGGGDAEDSDEEEEEDEGEDLDIDSGEDSDEDEEDQDEEKGSDTSTGPSDMQPIFTVAGSDEAAQKEDSNVAIVGGAVDAVDDASICEKLFKGMVFFLGREVPREPLTLVLRSFGAEVAWDGEGSRHNENSEEITHQVVDRPVQGHRFLNREYVQPQWVFDSANFRVLAPINDYAPGASLPPHLSPFATSDDYEPEWWKTMMDLRETANNVRKIHSGAALEEIGDAPELTGMEEVTAGSAVDDTSAIEARYQEELRKELKAVDSVDTEDKGNSEVEAGGKRKPASEAEDVEADELRMKKTMMSKKARHLYEKINQSKSKKAETIEKLKQKRQALASKRQKTTKLSGA